VRPLTGYETYHTMKTSTLYLEYRSISRLIFSWSGGQDVESIQQSQWKSLISHDGFQIPCFTGYCHLGRHSLNYADEV